jgi:hypothetical protein
MEDPRNFALVEDGVITNIIWMSPSNIADFPNAIDCGDSVVQIGDYYKDGIFVSSVIPFPV